MRNYCHHGSIIFVCTTTAQLQQAIQMQQTIQTLSH
jgi:hypothetical protein